MKESVCREAIIQPDSRFIRVGGHRTDRAANCGLTHGAQLSTRL